MSDRRELLKTIALLPLAACTSAVDKEGGPEIPQGSFAGWYAIIPVAWRQNTFCSGYLYWELTLMRKKPKNTRFRILIITGHR
jgi:hypothetical protein